MTDGSHGTALSSITIIGCTLSLFGLLITIIIHSGLAQLRRTIPSQLLLHLCAALAMALFVFLLASQASDDRSTCRAWAIGLHYLFLTAIAWMVVHGVNLYAIVVIVLSLRMGLRMKLYTIGGWGEFVLH